MKNKPSVATPATQQKIDVLGPTITAEAINAGFYVARRIGGENAIPTASLCSIGEFPECDRSEYQSGQSKLIHDGNAQAILAFLLATLPQGTVDRLAALLMRHIASELIVQTAAYDRTTGGTL